MLPLTVIICTYKREKAVGEKDAANGYIVVDINTTKERLRSDVVKI
jgi:hypothetical protein